MGDNGIRGRWSNSYWAIHRWVKRTLPKPNKCQCCKQEKKLDLAFNNHSASIKTPELYTDNPKDWEYLCRSCHMKADGRVRNLR